VRGGEGGVKGFTAKGQPALVFGGEFTVLLSNPSITITDKDLQARVAQSYHDPQKTREIGAGGKE